MVGQNANNIWIIKLHKLWMSLIIDLSLVFNSLFIGEINMHEIMNILVFVRVKINLL